MIIQQQSKKTILITGGCGFIGSHLVDTLMENENNMIVVVDDNSTSDCRNLVKWQGNSRFAFLTADIIEPLVFDFDRLDEIYHLACAASPVHYQANQIKTLKTCTIGTLNVLELARRMKSKILLASTSEVYGDPTEHPQTESYNGNVNIFGPRSCYDEGKRVAESMFYAYKETFPEIKIFVARIFNTFGPRMSKDDGRVVSNFIIEAINSIPIKIYGSGLQTRSFQYIDDLIDGLLKLMDSNVHEPINLGNPHQEYTINDFATLIKSISNSNSEIVYIPEQPDDPKQRRPDISKAKKLLNWEPRISTRIGLEKTIDYFRSIT